MKVVLEFDGGEEDFERAFDSMDEQFNINDSIFWEIDYGDGKGAGFHRTKHGDIKIKVER